MFSKKTVLVVGAGASNEAGLPVGMKLRDIIADKLKIDVPSFGPMAAADGELIQAIRRHAGGNLGSFIAACKRINVGVRLAASIDDFVDAHQDDNQVVDCAKLAIARSILEAEASSKLFVDPGNIYNTVDFRRIQDTWYAGFFRLLCDKVSKKDLSKLFENLTIVCFNYDRCIEHFLVHAICAFYEISREKASVLVNELKILRPYGSVGPLVTTEPSSRVISFGALQMPAPGEVIKNLRTYSEQIQDVAVPAAIGNAVGSAHTLVFLGCAFHSSNVILLAPHGEIQDRKRVFATRKGISDADLQVVGHSIAGLCGKAPKPGDVDKVQFVSTCRELFEEYRLSMRR